jgi:type IV secretion system protein VirD4
MVAFILPLLLLAGVVSYFVVGLGGLWLLRDLLGMEPRAADRAATIAFLVATPVLAFGPWFLLRGDRKRDTVDVTFGSARFMGEPGVARLTIDPGLVVGRDPATGKLIRHNGEAHLITIAPTRSGKGIGAIVPNLLTYEGSVLCVDPKGENAAITARARRRLGPVHVLDPFGVSGEPSASLNPLDALDPASPDLAEDAATLADALVSDPSGQVAEAHWNEEAKALIAGVLMHVACAEPPARRNLARVRELLTLAPDAWKAVLGEMQGSSAGRGLVARAANRQLGKSDREAAGVLSSAQRHTHFLDSPRMAAVTDRSDFNLEDLKARPATLFLVLPPDRLDAYSRWLRLVVAQAITALARARTPSPAPVLFLLDEFAALGRLEAVERAMGLMAGYGMRLWPILQDLHQLRSVYGPRAGTFLSNAGCVQVFNVNDVETAEWVSRSLGTTTVEHRTSSASDELGGAMLGDPSGGGSPYYDDHIAARPLLTPDEVRRLPGDRSILFIAGRAPILAQKVRYFADEEFRGLFESDEAESVRRPRR